MSPRQKEFCRLFAAGLPAAAAAHAAGYAKSTAERNAAAFIDHPLMAARIARLRARRNVVCLEDLQEAREKMLRLLRSPDEQTALKAAEQLCRLARLQARMEVEDKQEIIQEIARQEGVADFAEHMHLQAADLKEELERLEQQEQQERLEQPDAPATQEAQEQRQEQRRLATARLHEIEAQLPVIQGVRLDEKHLRRPPSFDALPSGEPAFDAPPPRLLPRKAKDIKEAYRKQTLKKLTEG